MKNLFLLGTILLAGSFANIAQAQQANCVPGVESPGCSSQAPRPNCVPGVESPGCPARPTQPPVNCIPGVESPGCQSQPAPQSPLFYPYNFSEAKTWLQNPSYLNACNGTVTLIYAGGDQIAAKFDVANCTKFTIWGRPGHGAQPFQMSGGREFRLSTNQQTGDHTLQLGLTDFFKANGGIREISLKLTNDYGNVGNIVSVHARDVE